jgi:hypothetical protein
VLLYYRNEHSYDHKVEEVCKDSTVLLVSCTATTASCCKQYDSVTAGLSV